MITLSPESTSPAENFRTAGGCVPSGADRHGNHDLMIWGVIPLATKIATKDTDGAVYLFEHKDMDKGGPPRHVHHAQDEWFYILKGEFVFEVGDERYCLGPGDSLFAPRHVPHVWACMSEEPGTMLTALSPAGTFETFITDAAAMTELPTPEEAARAFETHGMTIVGPPLPVE